MIRRAPKQMASRKARYSSSGAGVEGQSHYHPPQGGVHQGGTDAIPPVQGQQAAFPRSQPSGFLRQQRMDGKPPLRRLPGNGGRNALFHKPRKTVPYRRLSPFQTVPAGALASQKVL